MHFATTRAVPCKHSARRRRLALAAPLHHGCLGEWLRCFGASMQSPLIVCRPLLLASTPKAKGTSQVQFQPRRYTCNQFLYIINYAMVMAIVESNLHSHGSYPMQCALYDQKTPHTVYIAHHTRTHFPIHDAAPSTLANVHMYYLPT
ncbi:hypothetical protein DM02DRAFT_417583 [Periconia macrospinosa]|uniref:Uncharacterized protein n=1 Tax=Periconia macrospinosa TaxID=97972 RepID=A0A2V1DNM7_9PLEO|nr:hypothetical protein DM02DRAFT_417583 [Periconia macrospinosa]